MTVAQLMSNVVIAAKRQTKFDQKWDLSYLTLSPLEKVSGIRVRGWEGYLNALNQKFNISISFFHLFYQVPSDIEVASAQTPKNIDLVAKEVGLLPSEVDLYGKKKAKVALSTLERLKDRKNGKYVIVAGEIWFKLNQNH